jgi:glutamine amidotransferase
MQPDVTVVDYGLGNVWSVMRAVAACGGTAELAGAPDRISDARRLILPGVGAFRDGMAGLRERGLIEPVRRFAAAGRPFLGICLGMQMMLESSEEFGVHEGLGLIAGKVGAIPKEGPDGVAHKVPHIGWNRLYPSAAHARWQGTVLDGLAGEAAVYFVHSYAAVPESPAYRLADCEYGGRRIAAVVRSGSAYGCQFHPEKSGRAGLQILRNFLSMT